MKILIYSLILSCWKRNPDDDWYISIKLKALTLHPGSKSSIFILTNWTTAKMKVPHLYLEIATFPEAWGVFNIAHVPVNTDNSLPRGGGYVLVFNVLILVISYVDWSWWFLSLVMSKQTNEHTHRDGEQTFYSASLCRNRSGSPLHCEARRGRHCARQTWRCWGEKDRS